MYSLVVLAELVGLAGDEQANDETEQSENRAENLNDEDLDEAVE